MGASVRLSVVPVTYFVEILAGVDGTYFKGPDGQPTPNNIDPADGTTIITPRFGDTCVDMSDPYSTGGLGSRIVGYAGHTGFTAVPIGSWSYPSHVWNASGPTLLVLLR